MEEARCWMWTKQNNHGWSSNSQTSTTAKPSCEDDSWEEQAFAEDAAGGFGGCIWPPRSYSCSFCRREFRSAQALGGHMNVHRRDRARLKQSTNPYNELLHQNHVQYPCTSSALQYPSFASVYNPNPNSDFNSRVLAPPAKENSSENSLVVPSSSMVQGHHRSPFSSPKSWSNFVSSRYFRESDSKKEEDKNTKIIESGIPDMSVNLNLLVCRKRLTMSDDEDESFRCGKRKRTTDASPLPFFLKSSSPEVLELSTSSIEEIDLELRIGDRPKVK